MGIFVKAFAFLMLVYVINALPFEGQEQEVATDLFSVDAVPENSPLGEELNRPKRHYSE
jgi:hypothetical protein